MQNYNNYQSPLSWRYGSPEMRQIWSETHKRTIWRQIWVAVAETQVEFGLVGPEQAADLRQHSQHIDISRALEIEAEIHHDLMAEVKTFAEQSPIGGGIIHLGMTSTDIVDNADALRVAASLDILLPKLKKLQLTFAGQITQWAATPVMAFTHLQPAEPTTLGFRLAQYAQDLFFDWQNLVQLRGQLKGKGVRGAVGTSASFADLIGINNIAKFETRLTEKLGLAFHTVTTQVYPRKQDFEITSALAGLGASLYKFAFDLRILQSPPIGELAEPFGSQQVGSSAMPFKRNPIRAENIDSLARMLAQYPRIAWDNAAHSLLERTLDDSANRRFSLPEPLLIADQLIETTQRIVANLNVNQAAIAQNMQVYGPFAATERILMAAVKAGADRQTMHETLRQHALSAWEAIKQGAANPLLDLIQTDPEILAFIPAETCQTLMKADQHFGLARQKAQDFAQKLKTELQ